LQALKITLSEAEMKAISALTARNERFISVAAWAPDWTDGA
jgi:diketogulonate reductase-like aldo/keto reductase